MKNFLALCAFLFTASPLLNASALCTRGEQDHEMEARIFLTLIKKSRTVLLQSIDEKKTPLNQVFIPFIKQLSERCKKAGMIVDTDALEDFIISPYLWKNKVSAQVKIVASCIRIETLPLSSPTKSESTIASEAQELSSLGFTP